MAIPRERRITTRREIGRLLAGRRIRGRHLELFWRPLAAESRSRATCITPKYGHGSVERNRLRRRLRELIRDRLLTLDAPREYLVRARPSAYELGFAEMSAQLDTLIFRLEAETPESTSIEES